jgi:hypothetical protein
MPKAPRHPRPRQDQTLNRMNLRPQDLKKCLYLLLALVGASWFIANALRFAKKIFQVLRCPVIARSWAGAMIFMVLLCSLLSGSPALHQIIHPDANDEHHECAITMFAHGHVNLTDGGPILTVPVFRKLLASDFFEGAIFVSSDYLLLPGRAPPVPAS